MQEHKQTLTLSYISGSHPVKLNGALKTDDSLKKSYNYHTLQTPRELLTGNAFTSCTYTISNYQL